MSISSSLNAGVAGLAANATRLSAISDNIANSGTYGYKRAETEFLSLVLSGNSGSGAYYAGGVRPSTGRAIDEQGALVASGSAMDLAVSGRGFLPVVNEAGLDSFGSQPMTMTSTGSFRTDADGILKTESGLVLLGWPANADGTIPIYPRGTQAGLVPVVVNTNQTAGDPTTQLTLSVNLPATETASDALGDSIPLSTEYFGNLGTSETLDITFTPVIPATGSSYTWTMQIRDSASADALVGEYVVTFDDTRTSGGTIASVTTNIGGAYDPALGTLSVDVAGGPLSITIGAIGDTNGMTQLSDTFSAGSISKDGSSVGNLTGIEVDENGFLTASYDTGFSRVIYQIPLVDVPNPNGLKVLAKQTFQVSPQSGNFFLWDAGEGPTGEVVGYAREGSTTDVAAELTTLIQTQRAYSSNAKVIQTVDEMLQETTNIKR